MPWRDVSIMDERLEFLRLAGLEGANRRELCRRFGISPKTGYKWLTRHAAGEALADRSRRPKTSPRRSEADIEARILSVRDAHPVWGARKIARCVEREGHEAPAGSTVHAILQRHGRILPPPGGERAKLRFEREGPNQLWQMDFKGWVRLSGQDGGKGGRCHPLTAIDDHSRFAVCLAACPDEQGKTVKTRLVAAFRRHGLPDAIFVDNGNPWGDSRGGRWTTFSVWLLKLGVDVLHARPYHPQSRGKNERFHRTLKAEVMALRTFRSLPETQRAFDAWRDVYNHQRPHEALGQDTPASRYTPSSRSMPSRLVPLVYDEGEIVRIVSTTRASVRFKGKLWPVPRAFHGERLAIRPRGRDGQFGIFFASRQIASIDLTKTA
jgi:transposase InsO family protein